MDIKKTPALMIQGTASNAGKSLLCTALCRILSQKGWRVVPFKAQNMSNNAMVTSNGEEMATSQALQARACQIDAAVEMNPILLKPTTEGTSQCVVMGEVLDTFDFHDYRARRDFLWEKVTAAYDRISQDADLVIIEGAGSPAEINLRDRDIVNMEMAHYADAKVYLVGDIDRGGLFAAMAGTMELLDERDRDRIRGMIINRFRGDVSFLSPAIKTMEERYGRPFVGCVPFFESLNLPNEDSQDLDQLNWHDGPLDEQHISVLVPRFPHMANFSDLDPLLAEKSLQVIHSETWPLAQDIDVLILPGSKNTLEDLSWLNRKGWFQPILEHVRNGGHVIGVCGGMQMLGLDIFDPHQVETDRGRSHGLGALSFETSLLVDKKVRRSSVKVSFDKGWHDDVSHDKFKMSCRGDSKEDGTILFEISGYEIHHGVTLIDDVFEHGKKGLSNAFPMMWNGLGDVIGWRSERGNVWGTYLHGCFDDDHFRRHLMRSWSKKKNLNIGNVKKWNIEEEIDRWATHVESFIDLRSMLDGLVCENMLKHFSEKRYRV